MNDQNRVLRPGVSIVCAVKNRSHPLVYTIPTWLEMESVSQLVLVDWDSDIPLWDDLGSQDIPGWPDPRVNIVRAAEQPRWSIARAVNLGACLIRHETMFKLDADILRIGEIDSMPLERSLFYSGNWRTAACQQDVFLNGTMMIATTDFLSVGGFDERYVGYGWDDSDLYARLQKMGLRQCDFAPKTLFHLPHSDAKRLATHAEPEKTPAELIEESRLATQNRELWSAQSSSVCWDIETEGDDPNRYMAREAAVFE